MGRSGRGETRMWEVRCTAGSADLVVQWVRDEVVPGLWDDEDVVGYNAYSASGEDGERVVVIVDYLGPAGPALPELPAGLAARPPHSWVFSRLDV